jgi:formate--tetrahydrofolate ligase
MMHPDVFSVAAELGIPAESILPYGRDKGKVALEALQNKPERGRLILVSAITPTPAGEGKTTVSIGLAQGLRRIGKQVALALREPSMGPVFGRKGGATGGGRSSIVPADSINLHFTGDFHAITSAHNLLSAVVDNELHFQRGRLQPEQVLWKRVMDMNDRALRRIRVGVGGAQERASGFDITAASELMAILCLAENRADLRARLERMVVGFDADGVPVYARDYRVTGAMMAILKEALLPNLVQSVEGVPTFLHGGPFANIAHGCNSVLATRMALAHADYVVTEAGFAFDLGGEKFMGIKCRQSGLKPAAIVLVATVRALKMHGGVELDQMAVADPAAVTRGLENLQAHLDAAAWFGRPLVVAINRFADDVEEELGVVQDFCRAQGVQAVVADVFGAGGAGAEQLADVVAALVDGAEGDAPLPQLYEPDWPVKEKIQAIASRVYGAASVDYLPRALERLAMLEKAGLTGLPICMAKTQNSLSDNPQLRGRPRDFQLEVRDFELANGAGFLVALTGQMLRMPALPRVPAAEKFE